MHVGVNAEFLDPGRDEEPTSVLANDLELQHAVHEGHPVVDPCKAATGTFHIASNDATEKSAADEISSFTHITFNGVKLRI